ncbi:MAG: exodeoxyribonuclease VII small subunit [Clostridiaceae bacterium]|nr:exodeoxyribonuclease VII small subunit [Clostridiaceae bacterium]
MNNSVNTDPEGQPAVKDNLGNDEFSGLSYEEALAALEQIVAQLESGDANLDESMSLFQKGMTLSKICAAKLSAIEKEITQLIEKTDGQIEEKPFSEEL